MKNYYRPFILIGLICIIIPVLVVLIFGLDIPMMFLGVFLIGLGLLFVGIVGTIGSKKIREEEKDAKLSAY